MEGKEPPLLLGGGSFVITAFCAKRNMYMANSAKDSLLEALEEKNEDNAAMDEGVKNLLTYSLDPEEVDVFDAMTGNLDGLEGVEAERRRRGRPRKDSEDKLKSDRGSLSYEALRTVQKEKARKLDRLNPQPTEELQKVQDINAELREVEWDMADLPDSKDDAMNMLADIDNLREEAGIEKLDDSFVPYAEYRSLWNGYYEIKKESVELLKAIKTYVGNRDTKKAEELISTLKRNIKKLNNGYGAVKESYENVCSSLSAIADTRDEWRGLNSPAATEVMKHGFGLMDGENGARYQKRMHTIGRGNEIPKTIKKVDENVRIAETRWRSIAGISPSSFKTIKENWQKSIRRLTSKVALASNVKIADLNRILEGRYGVKKRGRKPDTEETELISSNGEDILRKIDNDCFGTDGSIRFGCLHSITPIDGDNDIGGAYGKIVVRWKPHSVVATMLLGNSLDIASGSSSGIMPSLFSDPSPCSFAPENRNMIENFADGEKELNLNTLCELAKVPYIELQLHGEGKYNAEDIESISFGSEDDYMNVSAIGDAVIDEYGIPIFIGDNPIEEEADNNDNNQLGVIGT